MINISYSVKITNPDKNLVLRIYPKDEWKANKEAYLYKLLAHKKKIPVPEVYKVDATKKIIPHSYVILSEVEGDELNTAYKKTKNKNLLRQAGEILAKIHSVKFSCYGWIMGKGIEPKFGRWADFVSYDLDEKIDKLAPIKKIPKQIIHKTIDYFNDHKNLLNIKAEPSLLHKDYHSSHIFAKSGKISGVIDMEWAIAGHNELDLAKSLWFMSEDIPEMERNFIIGYKKYGNISEKFEKRKELYKLTMLIGLLGLSYEIKNKKWFDYNFRKIKEILR